MNVLVHLCFVCVCCDLSVCVCVIIVKASELVAVKSKADEVVSQKAALDDHITTLKVMCISCVISSKVEITTQQIDCCFENDNQLHYYMQCSLVSLILCQEYLNVMSCKAPVLLQIVKRAC